MRLGDCAVLLKVFGPDQLYVNGDKPPVEEEERFKVPPEHTGELLEAFTVKPALTVTVLVDAVAVH